MRLQAVNAAAYTQSNTQLLGMRVTAVRDCYLYFCVNGKGVAADGPNVECRVLRGATNSTPGSAITPTKMRSQDSGAATDVATFLDQGSYTADTGGTVIDHFCLHPQYFRYSDRLELVAGEIADILTLADASATSKLRIRCVAWDRML